MFGEWSALGGLGQDITSTSPPATSTDLTSLATGFNSELVFLDNLVRANQGQSQLPISATAPSVNVGLTSGTMMIVAALGIGALVFMSKKKKH